MLYQKAKLDRKNVLIAKESDPPGGFESVYRENSIKELITTYFKLINIFVVVVKNSNAILEILQLYRMF